MQKRQLDLDAMLAGVSGFILLQKTDLRLAADGLNLDRSYTVPNGVCQKSAGLSAARWPLA